MVFFFGVFISLIVASACALIAYGIHVDHKDRANKQD
jgi:hypothetical protein